MNGKLTALQRQYLSRLGKAEVEQPTLTGDLLSDLVQGWTRYTTERLKQSLINSKNPTGRASDSLLQSLDAAKTRTRGKDVIGAINANDYYQYVDGGRGPTKGGGNGELQKALQSWIAEKQIPIRRSASEAKETVIQRNKSLAYVIARKIHAKGYKGNKFFSKIINDETFDEFAEYLGRAMGQKIALSISVMAKKDEKHKLPL
jgi:hypothetical protein